MFDNRCFSVPVAVTRLVLNRSVPFCLFSLIFLFSSCFIIYIAVLLYLSFMTMLGSIIFVISPPDIVDVLRRRISLE